MKTKVSIAMIFLLTLISCVNQKRIQKPEKPLVLTPLTESLIKEYDLTSEKLERLQFFNGPKGQDIILRRYYQTRDDTIADGKLIIRYLEKVDSVKIKSYTKGKMISFTSKLMRVSFESDTLSLLFGPNPVGNYILYAITGSKEIRYGTNLYQVVSGYGNAVLLIDLEQLRQIKANTRIAPGIEVK